MTDELGPDSLLWRYLGDRRYLFVLPRAVCLQVLHPSIAAGIADHALMRERIWLHKKRTVPQLINIAYTERDMRSVIRFAHEEVKGYDGLGRKYHSLNPELFHFQHATFVESLVVMVNTFIRRLDDEELEQLYRECCTWYGRYGISTRPMPRSWAEFVDYFDSECRGQLSAGEHFEQFRDHIFDPGDWWPRIVPRRAIRAMQHPYSCELTETTVSAADRRSLWAFARSMRVATAVPGLRHGAAVRTALRTT